MVTGQIGRYQLQKQIGRGGMARVFLATDPNFRREVAVKLIDAGLTTPDLQERFEKEARVIANLEHFAIVPVYDFGVHEGTPYMVMRLMTGGTLEDRLAGNPLALTEIDTILRRICAALDKAHVNLIVHRDLKPGNIMFDDQGVPYLADFGIARAIEGTQTRSVIGTPSYMSPEQARGEDLDPRTDVYQMGVILYEMLTGHRPFEGSSVTELVMKHVNEPVPPLATHPVSLPHHLEEVIQKAMAKQVADRQPTAGDLYREFKGQKPAESARLNSAPRRPEQISENQMPVPVGDSIGRKNNWLYGIVALIALFVVGWLALTMYGQTGQTGLPVEEKIESTDVQVVVVTQIATDVPAIAISERQSPTLTVPPPTPIPSSPTPPPPTTTPTPLPYAIEEIGQTPGNNFLEAYKFGSGSRTLVFIGGLHAGFAPSTVDLANQLIEELTLNPHVVPSNLTIFIIPNANPDSPTDPGELLGRLNARGVDLNRNWDCDWKEEAEWAGNLVSGGSRPFSEPETQLLADFITSHQPVGVVFWEARSTTGLVSPGGCQSVSQVSIPLSQAYAAGSTFSMSDFENVASYDVNGDGTNWLDREGIPAVAVLLRGYSNYNWSLHWEGIRSTIAFASQN